jgi:hypothetical protein
MTGAGSLAAAAAELYAADPGEFTGRRADLVAAARAAGDPATARQIAALRKPTRSAWLINQLVRDDPGVPGRLGRLGDELRAAAESLDAARIRESSRARQRLLAELVGQALRLAGPQPPGAGVREELTATFSAALADPEVARQLAAGSLVRPVRQDGLAGPGLELAGPGLELAGPGLELAGPGLELAGPEKAGAGKAGAEKAGAEKAGAGKTGAEKAGAGLELVPSPEDGRAGARARHRAEQQRAQRERAQRDRAERDRRERRATAHRAVLEAQRAARAAAQAEEQLRDELHRIEDQLAELRNQLTVARRRLGVARQRTRAAQRAEQSARQAAQRLAD